MLPVIIFNAKEGAIDFKATSAPLPAFLEASLPSSGLAVAKSVLACLVACIPNHSASFLLYPSATALSKASE